MEKYDEIKKYTEATLKKMGKENIKIHHLKEIDENKYICDISYIWKLNGWKKSVYQTNIVFIFKDGKLTSSLE